MDGEGGGVYVYVLVTHNTNKYIEKKLIAKLQTSPLAKDWKRREIVLYCLEPKNNKLMVVALSEFWYEIWMIP